MLIFSWYSPLCSLCSSHTRHYSVHGTPASKFISFSAVPSAWNSVPQTLYHCRAAPQHSSGSGLSPMRAVVLAQPVHRSLQCITFTALTSTSAHPGYLFVCLLIIWISSFSHWKISSDIGGSMMSRSSVITAFMRSSHRVWMELTSVDPSCMTDPLSNWLWSL